MREQLFLLVARSHQKHVPTVLRPQAAWASAGDAEARPRDYLYRSYRDLYVAQHCRADVQSRALVVSAPGEAAVYGSRVGVGIGVLYLQDAPADHYGPGRRRQQRDSRDNARSAAENHQCRGAKQFAHRGLCAGGALFQAAIFAQFAKGAERCC